MNEELREKIEQIVNRIAARIQIQGDLPKDAEILIPSADLQKSIKQILALSQEYSDRQVKETSEQIFSKGYKAGQEDCQYDSDRRLLDIIGEDEDVLDTPVLEHLNKDGNLVKNQPLYAHVRNKFRAKLREATQKGRDEIPTRR